ncbi:hypothetical protein P691DRAFT_699568 [Macrolepiota fuliginosa MF-IS2]|uniref:Nudix hydrolase domain-containing protein n=1 Tax=Macrolepiota fuliginosa MF-IS2 TaxID=1400762 RepID=A0A9P5XI43_9AGAR|nr:hypothetical protein P691DRAFT_699568 [Macrolepiota fuliginosa MF-IS2]
MNSVSSVWKKRQTTRQSQQAERKLDPRLSQWSSPAVPNGGWCSSNFLLGAGMVLIQRSTLKIVVIHESSREYWFLPRGRKDLGETLEAAALREAYEESGYHVEFMPVYNPSRAPAPPTKEKMYEEPNTEPIYVTMTAWKENGLRRMQAPDVNLGYEYLTSWYIGQIEDDAIPEKGTGMADEENYVSHLLTYEEAMKRLWDSERDVVSYAWAVFLRTLEIEKALAEEVKREERNQGATKYQVGCILFSSWKTQIRMSSERTTVTITGSMKLIQRL